MSTTNVTRKWQTQNYIRQNCTLSRYETSRSSPASWCSWPYRDTTAIWTTPSTRAGTSIARRRSAPSPSSSASSTPRVSGPGSASVLSLGSSSLSGTSLAGRTQTGLGASVTPTSRSPARTARQHSPPVSACTCSSPMVRPARRSTQLLPSRIRQRSASRMQWRSSRPPT